LLQNFHAPRRVSQFGKTVFPVQLVRFGGQLQKPPRPLQPLMSDDARHQPFRQTLAAVRREDEQIGAQGEVGFIGDDATETDWRAVMIDPEAERVSGRTFDDVARDAGRPVDLRG